MQTFPLKYFSVSNISMHIHTHIHMCMCVCMMWSICKGALNFKLAFLCVMWFVIKFDNTSWCWAYHYERCLCRNEFQRSEMCFGIEFCFEHIVGLISRVRRWLLTITFFNTGPSNTVFFSIVEQTYTPAECVSQAIDINEPIGNLKKLLEPRLQCSLDAHEICLQDIQVLLFSFWDLYFSIYVCIRNGFVVTIGLF